MTKQLNPSIVVPTHCRKEDFSVVSKQLCMVEKECVPKIVLDRDKEIERTFRPMKLY